jgi:guanylate kinase
MKPVILAIVGPSGSGKTTMANYLKKMTDISVLVSYTTRPMRKTEKEGIDHYFVDASQMPHRYEMLTYTKFGGHHYWALRSQIQEDEITAYVIDEKGLLLLNKEFGDRYTILSVYVKRDKEKREAQVSKARIKRDAKRINLPDSYYTLVIRNNYKLKDFYDIISHLVIPLLWKYKKK